MIIKLKISLIILFILIFSSFMPILQVVILFLNSGFIGLIGLLINNNNYILHYILNSIGSIILLICYFYSLSNVLKVILGFFFIFFFFPLISLLFENIIPKDPYFFSIILIGLLTGIMLLLSDFIKYFHIKN